MNGLRIPGTSYYLYDGTVVVLARFPGTKWVVHNGWYSYNSKNQRGWYLSSIPAQNIMPLTETDMYLISVVDENGCSCGCGGGSSPLEPELNPMNIYDEVSRAFITVDTLDDRDNLNRRELPNGKIVKVNNAEGSVKFYSWDLKSKAWRPETFGFDSIDPSNKFLTDETAKEIFYTKEEIDDKGYLTKDAIDEEVAESIIDKVKLVSIDGGNSKGLK